MSEEQRTQIDPLRQRAGLVRPPLDDEVRKPFRGLRYTPPIFAQSALLSYRKAPSIVVCLAIFLIAIEALLFLTPKVLGAVGVDTPRASFSLWFNPVRKEAVYVLGFHPLRDTNYMPEIEQLRVSLKNLDAAELRELSRKAENATGVKYIDYLDCAYPFRYGSARGNYQSGNCAALHAYMQEQDLLKTQIFPPYIQLATSVFLHAGLVHILMNILAFFGCAPLVALRMGAGRFLLFFVLAGIAGMALHFGIRGLIRGSDSPVVGASGAVMGLIGVHWRILYERRKRRPPASLEVFNGRRITANYQLVSQVKSFLIADMAFLLFGTFISGEAHIGGLIFGFLFGPLFLRGPAQHRLKLRKARAHVA